MTLSIVNIRDNPRLYRKFAPEIRMSNVSSWGDLWGWACLISPLYIPRYRHSLRRGQITSALTAFKKIYTGTLSRKRSEKRYRCFKSLFEQFLKGGLRCCLYVMKIRKSSQYQAPPPVKTASSCLLVILMRSIKKYRESYTGLIFL